MNRTVSRCRSQMPRQQFLHMVAGQRVERAERLVHQQHLGPVGQRAGDRDALLHAARKLARKGLRETLQPDQREVGLRDLPGLARRLSRSLQRELDIRQARSARAATCSSGRRRRGRAPAPTIRLAIDGDRRPRLGCPSPATIDSSVDLPQPEVPTSATNSFSPMSRSTPSQRDTFAAFAAEGLAEAAMMKLGAVIGAFEVAEQAGGRHTS